MEQFTWMVSWVSPGIIGACSNPVTERMIAMDPMIEIWDEQALMGLFEWIHAYCKAADLLPGHLDPVVVDASDWRGELPASS